MSGRDWRKAKKFAGKEEKWGTGTVLRSGRVVVNAPRDTLEVRAKEAEKKWLRDKGLRKI
jgi:hypothetical protein